MWNVPKMVKTLDSILWQASPGKSSLDVAALGCPPFFAGAFLLPCGVSKRYGGVPRLQQLCWASLHGFWGPSLSPVPYCLVGDPAGRWSCFDSTPGERDVCKEQSQNAQVFAEHWLSWSPQLSSFKKGGQAGMVPYLKLSLLLLWRV